MPLDGFLCAAFRGGRDDEVAEASEGVEAQV
jgi:hypothetical protein